MQTNEIIAEFDRAFEELNVVRAILVPLSNASPDNEPAVTGVVRLIRDAQVVLRERMLDLGWDGGR